MFPPVDNVFTKIENQKQLMIISYIIIMNSDLDTACIDTLIICGIRIAEWNIRKGNAIDFMKLI